MRGKRGSGLVRWIIVLGVLAALAFGAWRGVARLSRTQVTVTEAVQGPVVEAFYATGTLLPLDPEHPIKANAAGFVSEVLVRKGDVLKKDQPVAVVVEDGVEQAYQQALADRDRKKALADEKDSPILREFDQKLKGYADLMVLAQNERERVARNLERNVGTPTELDNALTRIKQLWLETEQLRAQRDTKKIELQTELRVAEEALKIAQWKRERQTIRNDIENATVLDWPVTRGTRLAVNDTLMHVADVRPQSLVMRASVDEEDMTSVHVGQDVVMTLYAYSDPQRSTEARDRRFRGKVKTIYPKADPERRTFEVDVEMIDKDNEFHAGMTGELTFIISQKDRATVIPRQAVQKGRVWVVRDGRLAKSDAKIGIQSVERAEVVSGLRDGDRVVISALDDPQEGQAVAAHYMDPAEAAALNRPQAEQSSFQGFK